MNGTLALMFVFVPVLAFAQARAPQVKRTNPPELTKPTGYTHIVDKKDFACDELDTHCYQNVNRFRRHVRRCKGCPVRLSGLRNKRFLDQNLAARIEHLEDQFR